MAYRSKPLDISLLNLTDEEKADIARVMNDLDAPEYGKRLQDIIAEITMKRFRAGTLPSEWLDRMAFDIAYPEIAAASTLDELSRDD